MNTQQCLLIYGFHIQSATLSQDVCGATSGSVSQVPADDLPTSSGDEHSASEAMSADLGPEYAASIRPQVAATQLTGLADSQMLAERRASGSLAGSSQPDPATSGRLNKPYTTPPMWLCYL